MAATAEKTNLALWEKVKQAVTDSDRGGKPGQWSARKAQLAVQDYKKQGGGYQGQKSKNNHLRQWTEEEWGTKSGKQSGETGERYLPKRARAHLSDKEYAETTAKKRQDTQHGKQFSRQPAAIARKTAADRGTGRSDADLAALKRSDLLARAAHAQIPGRSRMRKDELVKALA
ncbi:hypothetical protein [Rhodopila sp.]|uniref:hypothetical protein n=1 Tax=Rhodopila sp. TaxID=2480087 RepID=UPI003D126379